MHTHTELASIISWVIIFAGILIFYICDKPIKPKKTKKNK